MPGLLEGMVLSCTFFLPNDGEANWLPGCDSDPNVAIFDIEAYPDSVPSSAMPGFVAERYCSGCCLGMVTEPLATAFPEADQPRSRLRKPPLLLLSEVARKASGERGGFPSVDAV